MVWVFAGLEVSKKVKRKKHIELPPLTNAAQTCKNLNRMQRRSTYSFSSKRRSTGKDSILEHNSEREDEHAQDLCNIEYWNETDPVYFSWWTVWGLRCWLWIPWNMIGMQCCIVATRQCMHTLGGGCTGHPLTHVHQSQFFSFWSCSFTNSVLKIPAETKVMC